MIQPARNLECIEVVSLSDRYNVFWLQQNGQFYVGQKYLQPICRFGLINANMLLGKLISITHSEECIRIYYETICYEESLEIFARACEPPFAYLEFPYLLLDATGKEAISPPEFWHSGDHFLKQLDDGEVHLRREAISVLMNLKLPVGATIFDPACSTGSFLSAISAAIPSLRCVGGDISSKMVKKARTKLSHVFLLKEGFDDLPIKECEVLIIRFMNGEVVKSAVAELLFKRLRCLVPSGGYILIMGYTPIAIFVPFLANKYSLEVVQAIGSYKAALFQFYVLKAK